MYGGTRSGNSYSTSWCGFCYLNMCHRSCITVTTGRLDCDVDTDTALSQIAPPHAPTTGPPRAQVSSSGASRKASRDAMGCILDICTIKREHHGSDVVLLEHRGLFILLNGVA